MSQAHLVLAGGGHSHALMLLRWAMKPHLRPRGLVTLISRSSTTFYSGMLPGVIAGHYRLEDALIKIRYLADRAGVSFVKAEIVGIDIYSNCLKMKDRPAIFFTHLSLDIGSETFKDERYNEIENAGQIICIKPFFNALKWIEDNDAKLSNQKSISLNIVGSGLAAVEIAFAIRSRWKYCPISLCVRSYRFKRNWINLLTRSNIDVIYDQKKSQGPVLLCTGNSVPKWLSQSGLQVNKFGRLLTHETLQVLGRQNIFAVGDCAVLARYPRPQSGVWAVRASKVLTLNLQFLLQGIELTKWRPQLNALQLLGAKDHQSGRRTAWAIWGNKIIGPSQIFWKLKEKIDRNFMSQFEKAMVMKKSVEISYEDYACRGCASKISATSLKTALSYSGLKNIANQPEDAALIGRSSVIQSIDGFPALVSDPWLNGRLTTLHACTDIWASGGSVQSAQVVITVPVSTEKIQEELLSQSLQGVQSVLEPLGAKLIGGHTIESRSQPPSQLALGLQLALAVNGVLPFDKGFWTKSGMQDGDHLLVSNALGSGVLFAAAMQAKAPLYNFDLALDELSSGYKKLLGALNLIRSDEGLFNCVHACTDITGFGLLVHLSEMLTASNKKRLERSLPLLKLELDLKSIPSIDSSLYLFRSGFLSTLSSANEQAFASIQGDKTSLVKIDLVLGDIIKGSSEYNGILKLLFDPQTCGPIVISCDKKLSERLLLNTEWKLIGQVQSF